MLWGRLEHMVASGVWYNDVLLEIRLGRRRVKALMRSCKLHRTWLWWKRNVVVGSKFR